MDVLRSNQFDDIYFSVQNGFEETNHVFIKGNDLPQSWQGRKRFCIAETGFGTGLNFLAAWKLFSETTSNSQYLDYVSFEKYPLKAEQISEALKHWDDILGDYKQRLLEAYPILMPGFHRLCLTPNVSLTLIIGDINQEMENLEASVDCWFLDGFTPAQNPEMWTSYVFQQMARLSKPGASFATFTAAGSVRKGLIEAGFSVEKQKGFGRKRDMIVGHFEEKSLKAHKNPVQSVSIIGGGLAGTSCAYVLKQAGLDVHLYEAGPDVAAGASGNEIGLYNPRFSALRSAGSDFYANGFSNFLSFLKQEAFPHFQPSGCLHLINSEEKEKRFHSLQENWQWPEEHLQILSAKEAANIAGVSLEHEALYLPDSGVVSPRALCESYAKDIEISLESRIEDLSSLKTDIIILANGAGVRDFDGLGWVPVHTVRGQVTICRSQAALEGMKTAICYGGYITGASPRGVHILGSTFQKWLEHTSPLEEDDQDNIQRAKDNISSFRNQNFEIAGNRAGLRTSSHDRFPIVGSVPDAIAWSEEKPQNHDNMFFSTAHGSHGLVSSWTAAQYLADEILDRPRCIAGKTMNALHAKRFLERAQKKGSLSEFLKNK